MSVRNVSVGVFALLFLLSAVFVYGAVSVTLNTPTDREVLSGTYTVNASFDDTVNITVGVNNGSGWVQVNSSTDVASPHLYSFDTTTQADQNGTFSINVTIVNSTDAADVDVAIAVNLSIDNFAPAVNVLTPTGAIDGTANAVINASYSENGTLVLECNYTITNSTGSAMLSNVPLTLSGGLNNGFASGTLLASNFSEGAGYVVNVSCLDGYDRLGSDTSSFGYDTGIPMAFLTIISYARATVSLTGTATDGLSVQNLSIVAENNTGNYTACTNSSPGSITSGFLCSWDTTTFNDDSYDLLLTVQDTVGRTNTSVVSGVTVDNTNPSVVFVSPSAGANVTGAFNVTIQVTDATAGVNTTQVFLSNGTAGNLLTMSLIQGDVNLGNWSVIVDTTSLAEGNHVFAANVSDKAANLNTTVSLTLKVDNVVPFALLDAVPSIVRGLVNLTGSANDTATFKNYSISVVNSTSGDVVASYPRYAAVTANLLIDGWDTTTIPDGVYNLSLIVYDFVGGSNTSTQGNIRIDNTNPAVTLTLPTAGITYRGFVTVNATLIDAGAGINSTGSYPRIVIDGSAWALSLITGTVNNGMWSGSANTALKNDGANTLSIEAKDNASNQNNSVSIAIFIDNAAPQLTITSPAATAYTQSGPLVVNFTATDFGTTALRCNLSATNATSSGFNYSDTVANATPTLLTLTVGPGDWLWNVTCWDNATQDGVPLTGNSNTSVSRNYIVDATPGGIESVTLQEADLFVSDDVANNRITVLVNATDNGSGVASVLVNFSAITGNGLGVVSASYNSTTGLWNASVVITDASAFNFQSFNISVSATDNAANALTGANTVTVVLYNMTTPPSDPSGCTVFGALTTDMSAETDFSDVNFVNEIQLNGSAACNIFGQALPWGNAVQTVLLLNFTSVDMSNPASGALLSQLMDAIQVNITVPGQFGDSRIFVDSEFFSALNTSTRLTFYGLPFTTVPSIVADDLAEQAGISAITWSSAFDPNYNYTTGNLSFTVAGFSGYDVADNATPIIAVNDPTAGLNTTDNTTLINVTLNGTGSPISAVTFSVEGTTVANYTTANCANTTVGGELYTCVFSTSALADGAKTLTVIAYDYGGVSPGNNATATRSFTIDTTAPAVAISSPATNGFVQSTYSITGTVSDAGVGVLNVAISINGTVVGNATVNGTAWNFTRVSEHGRNENITANATDLLSFSATASVTNVRVDDNGPIFSSVSSGTPTTTAATITWTTDDTANESINYGTTTDLGTTSVSAAYETSHSHALGSLTANTRYYYNLTSCDQATNCNTTGPHNFTTAASGGGGSRGGGGAYVPAPALATAPKAVSLSKYGSYKFLARGSTVQHTLTIKEIRSDGVLFLLRSTPIEVFLKVGETKEIDVTGDAKPDVTLTLTSFSSQTAFIKIGQSNAAAVTAPVTPPVTTPTTAPATAPTTAPVMPAAPVTPPQTEPAPTNAPVPEETAAETEKGGIAWWVWALVFVVVIVLFVLLFGGKKKEPEFIPAHVSSSEHHAHK